MLATSDGRASHLSAQGWLAQQGVTLPAGQRPRISLFCYANAPVAEHLDALQAVNADVDLLVTPGHAHRAVTDWLARQGHSNSFQAGNSLQFGHLGLHALSYLSQSDYDTLLTLCDLNLVRGEDSLVSALSARRPFIWQVYVQDDKAHHIKLEALLATYLIGAPEEIRRTVMGAHAIWNRVQLTLEVPPTGATAGACVSTWLELLECSARDFALRRSAELAQQPGLIPALLAFVAEKRGDPSLR